MHGRIDTNGQNEATLHGSEGSVTFGNDCQPAFSTLSPWASIAPKDSRA